MINGGHQGGGVARSPDIRNATEWLIRRLRGWRLPATFAARWHAHQGNDPSGRAAAWPQPDRRRDDSGERGRFLPSEDGCRLPAIAGAGVPPKDDGPGKQVAGRGGKRRRRNRNGCQGIGNWLVARAMLGGSGVVYQSWPGGLNPKQFERQRRTRRVSGTGTGYAPP
jgi:hypothetical protein